MNVKMFFNKKINMIKKLYRRIKLFVIFSVACSISIGCSNADIASQEQTTLEEIEQVTVIDTSSVADSLLEASSTEILEYVMRNNAHSIFRGTIGQTEVQMKISRQDHVLTAAYITKTDDEKFFEGELKNSSEFELHDKEGGYLKGTFSDVGIDGTAMISGERQSVTLYLVTFFPIGYDYENYYSGVVACACSSKEVEEFAQKIKDSITKKETFLKLFTYPLVVRIEGEAITVNTEDEMANVYDILMEQTDFRGQIETMYTKYLFLTYDGLCVENGIMWFMEDSNGDYKIWTVNYRKMS